ncbi:MAG: LemA family protein [Opitutales bacterium]
MIEWIILGVVVLAVLAGAFMVVGIYNRLVKLKNRFKNAFAQIDVQLKRRHDLIPNLVETAKGYLKHEKETLENVIQARNQAASAREGAASQPDDPSKMQELRASEGRLAGAMTGFFALAEAYPDLKANQNMMQLTEELTSTENKVAFARQAFNDAVMQYNSTREQFPAVIFAGMFNFGPAEYFEIEEPSEREAPEVSF